jgi:hypothetical protein
MPIRSRSSPPTCSSAIAGSANTGSTCSTSASLSSLRLARSANWPASLCFARDSPAETAWSNSCTTSSSTSTADWASTVNTIG